MCALLESSKNKGKWNSRVGFVLLSLCTNKKIEILYLCMVSQKFWNQVHFCFFTAFFFIFYCATLNVSSASRKQLWRFITAASAGTACEGLSTSFHDRSFLNKHPPLLAVHHLNASGLLMFFTVGTYDWIFRMLSALLSQTKRILSKKSNFMFFLFCFFNLSLNYMFVIWNYLNVFF